MKVKKAQMDISMILYTFIAVLVGLILFEVVAQQVGQTTDTATIANHSQTAGSAGESIYLVNWRALSDVVIWNETYNVIGSGNYTIENNVIYNGALSVNVTVDDAEFEGLGWKISGTAQPLTYIANSGGRSLVGIITIFFALAIVVAAMYPVISSKLIESFG